MKRILLILFIISPLVLVGCASEQPQPIAEETEIIIPPAMPQTYMTELKVTTLSEGAGPEAKNGDELEMHYTGVLADGSKFDSSYDRDKVFKFILGSGRVIEGWDKGVLGMKVGEKRKLEVPYSMGYGDFGFPPVIPPKADLTFEIELMKIIPQK